MRLAPRAVFFATAAALVSGCAQPLPGGDDLAMRGDGGARKDGGGGSDGGGGTCPGKDLMNDPMNCGSCGHVCMGSHVATNACKNGQCVVGMCATGYFDVNQMGGDGCECQQDSAESSATSQCAGAASNPLLTDEPPTMVEIDGNIVPASDEDWYQIQAVDTPDADNTCDKYDLKVSFSANPGMQFRFDLFFDNCVSSATCQGQGENPTGLTSYEWNSAGDPNGGTECPCSNGVTAPNVHKCTDNSQTLRIRVYRVMSMPVTCDTYKLLVTNGM